MSAPLPAPMARLALSSVLLLLLLAAPPCASAATTETASLIPAFSAPTDAQLATLKACLDTNVGTAFVFKKGTSEYTAAINRFVNQRTDIAPMPALVVQPDTTALVSATVKCAAKAGVQLCAKGGGNGVENQAACTKALMVDMVKFTDTVADKKTNIVKFSAGNSVGQVFDVLGKQELITPLGISGTTGAVGLALGCGKGHHAQIYGDACQSILKVEYVDAMGQVQTVGSLGAAEGDGADGFMGGKEGKYAYVGCRKNVGADRLGGEVKYLTLSGCAALAVQNGHKFWGLENPNTAVYGFGECLTFPEMPLMSGADDTDCEVRQLGDGSRLGGTSRLAVYSFPGASATDTADPVQYAGCYVTATGGSQGQSGTFRNLAVDACQDKAALLNADKNYFGLWNPGAYGPRGYADCLTFPSPPSHLTMVADDECQSEVYNKYNMGDTQRMALYRYTAPVDLPYGRTATQGMTFKGCYKNNGVTVARFPVDHPGTALRTCRDYAAAKGKAYFASQFPEGYATDGLGDCVLLDALPNVPQAPTAECQVETFSYSGRRLAADPELALGGFERMAVYSTQQIETTTTTTTTKTTTTRTGTGKTETDTETSTTITSTTTTKRTVATTTAIRATTVTLTRGQPTTQEKDLYGVKYEGCYNNHEPWRIYGKYPENSVQTCADLAMQNLKGFFGLEWPGGFQKPGHAECIPLPNIPSSSPKVADVECEQEMAGTWRLGGDWRLAVYSYSMPAEPIVQYEGCWNNKFNNGSSIYAPNGAMSYKACSITARHKNHTFIGLEDPGEFEIDGYSQCITMADAPFKKLSEVDDDYCEGELYFGHRMGAVGKIAVYSLLWPLEESTTTLTSTTTKFSTGVTTRGLPPPPAGGVPRIGGRRLAASEEDDDTSRRLSTSEDMLWMAKGAGGEFPGIVTKMYMKTYTMPYQVKLTKCVVKSSADTATIKKVIQQWITKASQVTAARKVHTKILHYAKPKSIEVWTWCMACSAQEELWADAILGTQKSNTDCTSDMRSWTGRVLDDTLSDYKRWKGSSTGSPSLLDREEGWRKGEASHKWGSHLGYTWTVSDDMLDDLMTAMNQAPSGNYNVLLTWSLLSSPTASATPLITDGALWEATYWHRWADASQDSAMLTHHDLLESTLAKYPSTTSTQSTACTGTYNYEDNTMACAKTNDQWLSGHFDDVDRMRDVKDQVDPYNIFRSKLRYGPGVANNPDAKTGTGGTGGTGTGGVSGGASGTGGSSSGGTSGSASGGSGSSSGGTSGSASGTSGSSSGGSGSSSGGTGSSSGGTGSGGTGTGGTGTGGTGTGGTGTGGTGTGDGTGTGGADGGSVFPDGTESTITGFTKVSMTACTPSYGGGTAITVTPTSLTSTDSLTPYTPFKGSSGPVACWKACVANSSVCDAFVYRNDPGDSRCWLINKVDETQGTKGVPYTTWVSNGDDVNVVMGAAPNNATAHAGAGILLPIISGTALIGMGISNYMNRKKPPMDDETDEEEDAPKGRDEAKLDDES